MFGEMETWARLPKSQLCPRVSRMVSLHSDTAWNPWKLMVVVAFLVLFACVGIAHVVKPDWLIERSGAREGGEMLTEWNRFGFGSLGLFSLEAQCTCSICSCATTWQSNFVASEKSSSVSNSGFDSWLVALPERWFWAHFDFSSKRLPGIQPKFRR